MGLIRKTFSLATLGAVNYRSADERLEEAETERDEDAMGLDLEGRF